MQDQREEYEEIISGYKSYQNSPLKVLMHLYKGNIRKLLLSVLFFIIKNSPVWVIPITTANIIDIASKPDQHNLNELWINMIVAAVVIIQNIPTHMLHTKYFSEAVRHVEAGLRNSMVKKLQQLSISSHKELKSGKLQSKMIRDVEAIEFLSRQFSATILPVIFNVAVALAVTLSKSYIVALFFLLTIPVSVLMIRFFRKNIRQKNNEFRKEIEEMSSKVSEMVEMIPVTRAHGLEELEIERMSSQLERVKNKGYRLDISTAFFGASSFVNFQLFQLICLAFTGYMAYKGRISIGEVVLYQGYFGSILGQISGVLGIYPNLAKGIESVKSVGEILLDDDIERNKGKKKVKSVQGNFIMQNVDFKYRTEGDLVLSNFNLEVKAGECIALVGESGAGKSTILNLVVGFYKPTAGKIILDDKDMSELDLASYRQHIAVVPQNTILFSGSILDNITYGMAEVDEKKLWDIIEKANLKELIDKLPDGIDTMVGEHGDKLSGGQRQRISIARALIRDPKIIVLDEATSALDNFSEFQVQKAMKELVKGRTTFIVAHRFSTIRDADRIAVVKDGKCMEIGSYDELMSKKGEFYKLNSLQTIQ